MHCLHEFATPECGHILPSKLEPFTVLPSFSEPLMPVSLNSDRIIGLDYVYRNDWLRKLDGQFIFSASRSVTAADLVILPGLEQIDGPDRRCRVSFNRRLIGFVTSCERSTDGLDILPAGRIFAPTYECRRHLCLTPESCERVVAREVRL
jgi:hypothetical protein